MYKSSHLEVLQNAIRQWQRKSSQNDITLEVLNKVDELKLSQLPEIQAIKFKRSACPATDLNTNRIKLFRLLGLADVTIKSSIARVFYLEKAIVAAMPLSVRIVYLNQLYGDGEITVVEKTIAEVEGFCPISAITTTAKENAESQMALAQYDGSRESAEAFVKEGLESIETTKYYIGAVMTDQKKRSQAAA